MGCILLEGCDTTEPVEPSGHAGDRPAVRAPERPAVDSAISEPTPSTRRRIATRRPAAPERLFVEHPFCSRPANHEHPFVVNTRIEQMFAIAAASRRRLRTSVRRRGAPPLADDLRSSPRPLARAATRDGVPMSPTHTLTARQQQILDCIETAMRDRGYPPSVREIGEAVGLTSPSTVHSHLASLQKHRLPACATPAKPRAIEVRYDPNSGRGHRAPPGAPRAARRRRRRRHRRAGPGERRGDLPAPGRPHRRRRPLHAAGAGRLDDRRRHPRRRLRRRPGPDHRRATATSSSPASPARRPRSRPSPARATRSCCVPANARLRAHGVRPRRGHHLRQGRHGPAQALSPAPGAPTGRLRAWRAPRRSGPPRGRVPEVVGLERRRPRCRRVSIRNVARLAQPSASLNTP